MTIGYIICGGTIDKSYFPERETFDFEKTHTNELLRLARIPEVNINTRFLFLKDSLDMDDTDVSRINRACKESLSHKIIIAHGTSRMIHTAQSIANDLPAGKTIVLFGAMIPFELYKSDALFNFGTALMACQLLDPGVYISMNGKVWPHDQVEKNDEDAIFIDKRSSSL